MTTLSFLLTLTAYVALKVIVVFLLAIPSGIGLAAGFHLFRKWFVKEEKKEACPYRLTPEEIEKKYGNFFQREVTPA